MYQPESGSPSSGGPSLARIVLFLRPYLNGVDRLSLSLLSSEFRYWEVFGDCPLACPTLPWKRRLNGFGKLNPKLAVRHITPSPYFVIHKAWDFLTPSDRHAVAVAAPPFEAYARLRRSTTTVSIAGLLEPRPDPSSFSGLQKDRAWRMAVALMRFDMNLGDLIRWLEGEYTNAHRDWEEVASAMNAVRDIQPPDDYPAIDFDRAFKACTDGVPLAGQYECSFESVKERNLYDNHPGLQEQQDVVRERFAKEEAQSFYIALPRFLWRFLCGIHLAALVWNMRKGKGRLCTDPTTVISETDDGAANDSIPAPGTEGREDECPGVHYATAFHRHVTQLWNLRISFPTIDILQSVDDLKDAFKRMLYHPDGILAFAAIFMEFLMLPIGTIFGARNSPSFFSLTSEARSHIASNRIYRPNDDPENLTVLARRVRLVPDLTPRERFALVPAVADEIHQGVPKELADRYHNSTFVDDNGIADRRDRMIGAIDNSVRAAFDMYGHPDNDRRAGCLSEEKWHDFCSFLMLYLGFDINTRDMLVAWPVEKRLQLADLLDDILRRNPCILSPKESSSLLGLLRNAAPVGPLGVYLSLRVQYALNGAIQRVWQEEGQQPPRWWRHWYRRSRFLLPRYAVRDLSVLRSSLDSNPSHPAWNRYIGLIVDRSSTHLSFGDASYAGLGAWSASFNFKWRLYREDLIDAGFDMKAIDDATQEPDGLDPNGEHINVLEFVTVIIQAWFIIRMIMIAGDIPGGYIVGLLADNTSALSWMRYAARSHRPVVRDLSRFFMALTLACPISFKLSGRHIQGKKNVGADALSRPADFPTWACATRAHSPLKTCQAYRVPSELLSSIAMIISAAKTGEEYEPAMTRLLTLELTTLSTGFDERGSNSSYSRGTHRGSKSR